MHEVKYLDYGNNQLKFKISTKFIFLFYIYIFFIKIISIYKIIEFGYFSIFFNMALFNKFLLKKIMGEYKSIFLGGGIFNAFICVFGVFSHHHD